MITNRRRENFAQGHKRFRYTFSLAIINLCLAESLANAKN